MGKVMTPIKVENWLDAEMLASGFRMYTDRLQVWMKTILILTGVIFLCKLTKAVAKEI